MIVGFKAMAEHLRKTNRGDFHPDTLRKAVSDDRNPLEVEWDNGFAQIEEWKLIQWRERRKGLPRRRRKDVRAA